ncbi:MAG TPA: hypothetical protein P5513_04015 [Candidatus Diapherotrites archaeon]|nr:hypothetical protein [Candidatus Diapherotrites archaeon]
MIAKKIPIRAYCFDFDDTLVKTDAKIYIYKNGKKIKSLTSKEINNYVLQPGETIDLRDFSDPRLIMRAKKYKMWPVLKSIDMNKKMGKFTGDIYILTARSPVVKNAIYVFLKDNGIDIPLENIITVNNESEYESDVSVRKEKVLKDLKNKYVEVFFYDDNEENIRIASKIGGIKTILID